MLAWRVVWLADCAGFVGHSFKVRSVRDRAVVWVGTVGQSAY